MRRSFHAYLWDIADAIGQIEAFVQNLTFEQYLSSELVRSAVERKFEIIGEAIKQANQIYPGQLDRLFEQANFARFRDKLAHGYFDVKHVVVWTAIHDDLPSLRTAISALIDT